MLTLLDMYSNKQDLNDSLTDLMSIVKKTEILHLKNNIQMEIFIERFSWLSFNQINFQINLRLHITQIDAIKKKMTKYFANELFM